MYCFSTNSIKKLDEIEYLRGFAILAVIAIHTSANFVKIQNINILLITNVIIDVFSQFAVPLFIFISGFVLSFKYKGLFSHKTFYEKRLKSILPQYIIFSTLFILLDIASSAINGNLKFPSVAEILFRFFTASSYYHLWFFALIIQLYLFYPYIIRIYEWFTDKDRIVFFIFLSFIVQQVWLIIKGFSLSYITSSTYFNTIGYFNEILKVLLTSIYFSYIFYFIIGIYLCQNYESVKDKLFNFKKWILPMAIILTGVISALWINGINKYGSNDSIPAHYLIPCGLLNSIYYPLIFSILLIISLNLLNNKNQYSDYSKAILFVGKYSFGIYLIHPIYMVVITGLIFPHFNVDFNNLIFYPILFILTLILSYFSVYLISYSSYSEIIIGIKNDDCKKPHLFKAYD